MAKSKVSRRNKIRKRIRGVVTGTAARPRLSVYRSNKDIYVQLIDDTAGVTLASWSCVRSNQEIFYSTHLIRVN